MLVAERPWGFDSLRPHPYVRARPAAGASAVSSSGFSNVAQLLVAAKARPGSMNYGSAGMGSSTHLVAEKLKAATGIDAVHVPYKGAAASIADVIGGHVDAAFASVPSVISSVQSNVVRALAVSSARRVAVAPEIPTIAESGLPGYQMNTWNSLVVPRGTPGL